MPREPDSRYVVVMLMRRGHAVRSVLEYELPSKMGRTMLMTTLFVSGVAVSVRFALLTFFCRTNRFRVACGNVE